MPKSSRAVYITMIRHGESLDNLTSKWAGQRDAPLSVHGFNQSMRLAKAFEETPITGECSCCCFSEVEVCVRCASLLGAPALAAVLSEMLASKRGSGLDGGARSLLELVWPGCVVEGARSVVELGWAMLGVQPVL